MLTLKSKRASLTLLGFIRVIPPRDPPNPPPTPPGGRFRCCYARPCTEGVAAARHQLLSDCTHPAFPPPGEPRDSGFRTSARPFPRKLSADVRARDGKTEVVAGSGRRSVFRRTPPLSRSEEERRKKNKPTNLPAHVTSISFALCSGASTTQRR